MKKLAIVAACLLLMASYGCNSEEAKKETVEKTQEATTTIKEDRKSTRLNSSH